MGFSAFMTGKGTLREITTDSKGDKKVVKSYSVKVDPGLGYKQVFTKEGERVTGTTTIIEPTDNFKVSHNKYELDYDGRVYQMENMKPIYSVGGNVLEHIEVVMR